MSEQRDSSSTQVTAGPDLREQSQPLVAPSIDEVTNRLLQVENLAKLEKLGLSVATIQRVNGIAKELSTIPNEQYKERLKRLKAGVDGVINDPATFSTSRMVRDMVLVDSQDAYVGVNNFGRYNTIGVDASDEDLVSNPENKEEGKIHVQVPDDLVPFVGILLLVALKQQALKDYAAGKESPDVAVASKLFAGYRSVHRAEAARIVIYLNGKFSQGRQTSVDSFRATVDIIAPIMEAMNIGGLVNEARTENDVKPPSFNVPIRQQGNEVPNTSFAVGHSHLRRELAKRKLLEEVYDSGYNYAIPLGFKIDQLTGYL